MRRQVLRCAAVFLGFSFAFSPVMGDPKKKEPPSASSGAWGSVATVANACKSGLVAIRAPQGWVRTLAIRGDMVFSLPAPDDASGVFRITQLDNIANGVVMGNLYLGFVPATDVFAEVTVKSLATAWANPQNLEFDRLVTESVVPTLVGALKAEGKSLKGGVDAVVKRLKAGKTNLEVHATDADGRPSIVKVSVPSRSTPGRIVVQSNGAESFADLNVRFVPAAGSSPAVVLWSVARYINQKDDCFTPVLASPAVYADAASWRAESTFSKGAPTPTYWRFGGLGSVAQKNVWMLAQATLPGATVIDRAGGGAEIWSDGKPVGRFDPSVGGRQQGADPDPLASAGTLARSNLKDAGAVQRTTEHGIPVEIVEVGVSIDGADVPHLHTTSVIGPSQSLIFVWTSPKDFPLDLAVGWAVL